MMEVKKQLESKLHEGYYCQSNFYKFQFQTFGTKIVLFTYNEKMQSIELIKRPWYIIIIFKSCFVMAFCSPITIFIDKDPLIEF
jgi:hypothetical protein